MRRVKATSAVLCTGSSMTSGKALHGLQLVGSITSMSVENNVTSKALIVV